MFTFIILLAFLLLGIYLYKNFKFNANCEFFGSLLIVISPLSLAMHCTACIKAPFDYYTIEITHKNFIETLSEARKSGNPIEIASITKNIANWNACIAEAKYRNSILLLDPYIDDRIETLEPIK